MKVKLAPSLMCMDLLNVAQELKILDKIADYYHIDIIDWHYVKNMALSPLFMHAVKSISNVPQEAHLYVDNLDIDLIDLCIDNGAELLILAPEIIEKKAFNIINHIKNIRHKKVGVFINPAANLNIIEPYIELLDRVLIMTVDPGFAGQSFIQHSLQKIARISNIKQQNNYNFEIGVDGCCNENYYHQLYEAGAEVFILGGSGLFNKDKNLSKALQITLGFINTL